MLLSRYNPFKEIVGYDKKLFDDYNDFFRNNEFPTFKPSGLSNFTPVVNTREDDNAFHIDADLPGVKKEDIHVDVKDGILTITGERNHKEEVKEEDYYKVETSFGKFQRSFTLPSNVDSENINASTNNGVLEVTIPKIEKKEDRKKIEVK